MKTVLFSTQHYQVFINSNNGLSALTVQRKDKTGGIIVDTERGPSGSTQSIFYELIQMLNLAQFNYTQELRDRLDEEVDIKEVLRDLEYAIDSARSGLDDIQCAKDDLENRV